MESDRRNFIGTAAGAAALTLVPRHVLGGPGYVAPSDKVNLAYIGTGTQGLREMIALLPSQDIQIVAVCDACKGPVGYRDWNRDGLTSTIRRALGKPDWRPGPEGTIPGGRDVGKNVVDTFYKNDRCASYADFREMFDKQKDIDAVKIMTPDHLHAVLAMAAMKRGKHVITHKPIANRLKEARLVIETAREKKVATHFVPWDANGSMDQVMAWVKDGSIGTLREVHNWTNRPMWPQYPTVPTDRPPVPEGFNWDLWLGPETNRPYHPDYTHMVFRGWYDFGGGSMADMGHYSLWTVFNALQLSGPTSIDPMLSHECLLTDHVATTLKNDYSFPYASVVRFKYPAKGNRAAVDLYWYEGGMRPATPEELDEDKKSFPEEGFLFVGDKGKVVAGFHVENPRLIPERRMKALGIPDAPPRRGQRPAGELSAGMKQWVEACRGGAQSPGSFLNAGPITEAVNLYAVALRTRKRLLFDAENTKFTNAPEANQHLAREYRKGWEPSNV